ncbi:MAG: glycosyltransferase family 2 protein [Chloroflexi bacterium]|nr:glycosyltransferase family 2 protein [Chloroflexota bacterium]
MNVTAIVPARDEERNIVDCLESLAWADRRVLFMDSRTIDRTEGLAQEIGTEVIPHHFENFGQFHNAAMDAVEAEWIFFVDADERATPELAEEIRSVTDGTHEEVAWAVPRHNYIFGRLTLGAGWYPDYQSRLLLRNRVRWERPVHEVIVTDGSTGHLKNPLIHYNYDDLPDFVARQKRYTDFDAGILKEQGVHPRFYTPYTQTVRHFWWRFMTLKGMQDGLHGLWLSLLMAYYEAVKYRKLARLWQSESR